MKNLFFFIIKIFRFIANILSAKKLLNLITALSKICFIPRYIPDLYQLKIKHKIHFNDIIFIPSGRPHILQSIIFLYLLDKKIFQYHFRIVHPVKYRKKKDNFFKYLDIFKNLDLVNKKIFFLRK